MHMCTNIPNDPKLVLALRVTEESYDTYLHLASGKRGRKVSKETLIGSVIVVPIDIESSWGWMDRDQFDDLYASLQSWSKRRFTLCTAIANPVIRRGK